MRGRIFKSAHAARCYVFFRAGKRGPCHATCAHGPSRAASSMLCHCQTGSDKEEPCLLTYVAFGKKPRGRTRKPGNVWREELVHCVPMLMLWHLLLARAQEKSDHNIKHGHTHGHRNQAVRNTHVCATSGCRTK